MKIIQRFKDVYDHIFFRYGQDPKVVWDRKTVQVAKLPPKHRCFDGRLKDNRDFKAQILVVNQTVLLYYVDNKGQLLSGFYPKWRDWNLEEIQRYLVELETYTDKYNAPVVLVGTYVDDKGHLSTGVFANPQLNIGGETAKLHPEVSVFQNVDHQLLYTEINAWFGRHASEPKMVQLSDKDKLEKHGFDNKTSFRGK